MRNVITRLLVLFFVSVSAIACGPSEKSPLESVTVQLNWFPDGELAYWYYGVAEGYFEASGFEVTINGGKGSSLSARLLVSGAADVAVMGPDAFLRAIEDGADLVSLGVIYDSTPVSIYSRAEKGITQLTDLYGHTLGLMAASNTLIQYTGIAKRYGLDRARIEEITVDPAVGPKLVEDGTLDAMVHYTHYPPLELKLKGVDVNEILFRDLGLDMIGMIVAVRRETLGQIDVPAFRMALIETIQGANQNRSSSLEALTDEVDTLGDLKYERAKLDIVMDLICTGGPECSSALEQSSSKWSETVKSLQEFEVINSSLDPHSFILTE